MAFRIMFFDTHGNCIDNVDMEGFDTIPCDEQADRIALETNVGEYSRWEYELIEE